MASAQGATVLPPPCAAWETLSHGIIVADPDAPAYEKFAAAELAGQSSLVGETVILRTPPSPCLLKSPLKGEGAAAD